jgi:hypothetical protein
VLTLPAAANPSLPGTLLPPGCHLRRTRQARLLLCAEDLFPPGHACASPAPQGACITNRPDGTPAGGVPEATEGWLVAHSDGFWQLFVVANEQHELLAVPDNDVAVARILEKPPQRTKPFVMRMVGEEASSASETKPKEDEKPGEQKAK